MCRCLSGVGAGPAPRRVRSLCCLGHWQGCWGAAACSSTEDVAATEAVAVRIPKRWRRCAVPPGAFEFEPEPLLHAYRS